MARVTIETLPDVALLEIFDFYTDEDQIEAWHTLVHLWPRMAKTSFWITVAWICDFSVHTGTGHKYGIISLQLLSTTIASANCNFPIFKERGNFLGSDAANIPRTETSATLASAESDML